MGDTDSIYPRYEGQLGRLSQAANSEDITEPHRQVAIYMAGAAQPQPNPAGNNETGGSSKAPVQVMADLAGETTKLLAVVVIAENQDTINTELAKLQEQMAKTQRDVEAEAARMATQHAQITAETERLNTEHWLLERQQRASDAIHERRHHGRLPADLNPTRLFDSPHTPGMGPD